MTLREYLKEKTELLSRASVEDAENEVWTVLMTCLLKSRGEIRASLDAPAGSFLSSSEEELLEDVFTRRASHEPLAYIVGHAPFYDLEFKVGKGVLIPRFDTEILVETALSALGFPDMTMGISSSVSELTSWTPGTGKEVVIYDLCTGSGIIGITLAHLLSKKKIPCRVIMTEISEEASAFAKENIDELTEGQVELQIADLWPEGVEKADLIVSNPPYVRAEEMAELSPEVRDFEPAMALTDGSDGLSIYRRIAEEIGNHLKKGGAVCLEHGCGQREEIEGIFKDKLAGLTCISDYGHRDRVTCGIYKGEA